MCIRDRFWNALSQLKLNKYQLSDDLIPAQASYGPVRAIIDRATGKPHSVGCRIRLGSEGLLAPGTDRDLAFTTFHGYVKNFNTLEEFKTAHKQTYFFHVTRQVRIITIPLTKDLGGNYRGKL